MWKDYWSNVAYKHLLRLLDNQMHFIDVKFLDGDFSQQGIMPGMMPEQKTQFSALAERIFVNDSRAPALLGDRHFNEIGYDLLARKIAQGLVSTYRLDEEGIARGME